jgi:hypothetical protein
VSYSNEVEELKGLLRVAQGQRDDYEKLYMAIMEKHKPAAIPNPPPVVEKEKDPFFDWSQKSFTKFTDPREIWNAAIAYERSRAK